MFGGFCPRTNGVKMLKIFNLNQKMKLKLRKKLQEEPSEFNFQKAPQMASLVTCLGINQEIGSKSDELHKHIFDKKTGKNPERSSMCSEIVTWKGLFGIRIFSTKCKYLKINHPQIKHLIHPEFSRDINGNLIQLVIFPQIVAKILSLQNIELVIVKQWALNTVFGGFDSEKNFYVTNEWEIRQNDSLRMAHLISKRQLAFIGTHDFVAHISGADSDVWNKLQLLAAKLIPVLSSGNQMAITHLLVPYIIGVLLDDLSQPAHYESSQRLVTIDYLSKLQHWIVDKTKAQKNFHRFPSSFSSIIEESRAEGYTLRRIKELIKKMSLEIQIFGAQEVS